MKRVLTILIASLIIHLTFGQNFYYNQLGYFTKGQKHVVIDETELTDFSIISVTKKKKVYAGKIHKTAYWSQAGADYSLLDFSDFKEPGEYYISVLDYGRSDAFTISDNPYHDVLKASLKAFYYNRSSTELKTEHAGIYNRAAGHPDDQVMIHSSAADEKRPEGTIISSPKGWYDAGDYGKYIVNSGISTFELLMAYDHYKTLFDTLSLNIPESSNSQADLLDEIKWNVDWMLTMQDPNDGGVYHKLTTLNFSGHDSPNQTKVQRYAIGKSTAATLNYASVMAYLARQKVLGNPEEYMKSAQKAMAWAALHPDSLFKNPEDVKTGEYGDKSVGDEFNWANTEMLLAGSTGKIKKTDYISVPSWNNSTSLGIFSEISVKGKSKSDEGFMKVIDKMYKHYENNIFRVSMGANSSDFVWGSNASAANQGIMFIIAYKKTNDPKYLNAATGLVDYLLGKNPTGYCYVTGFGIKPPMHIHHRPSIGDTIEAPVPGFMAGGPHNGKQDQCVGYPSNYNAKCYLDAVCSYSTNEIAINWNAPLVYLLAAVEFYSLKGELK